ncbi:hypothetical protein HanIR_Chr17g0855191 [Helianthus annuus]|nr:hypothetical protein HanIR_Chr17g0855191 [Helianthus annuus]
MKNWFGLRRSVYHGIDSSPVTVFLTPTVFLASSLVFLLNPPINYGFVLLVDIGLRTLSFVSPFFVLFSRCSLEGCTPISVHDSQTGCTVFTRALSSDTKCWFRPLLTHTLTHVCI